MSSGEQSSDPEKKSGNTDSQANDPFHGKNLGDSPDSKGNDKRKPDLYVIARIISVLKEKGSLNRTTLATSTGLAYNRLVEYLQWMNDRDFIKVSEDGYVSLTPAGAEAYNELVRWILRYVGKMRFPRL